MNLTLNLPRLDVNEVFEKCTIVSLDRMSLAVSACFNPNKVKMSKSVPWNRHSPAGSDGEMLEFTNGKNRTLTLELFFDGYEKRKIKGGMKRANVETEYVDRLLEMTRPDIPVFSGSGLATRPHFVMLVWGKMSRIKGVIESIDTEFNMFDSDGTPVRATCSLKVTEIDPHQFLKGMAKKLLDKASGGKLSL